MSGLAYIDLGRMVACLDDGTLLPIDATFDADCEPCEPEDAEILVVGSEALGYWSVDLRLLLDATLN